MKTSGISIVVVDDYQPWRNYVCSTLPQWLNSPVITEACDGLEGVSKARELQPDLILLDVGLPELNGIEAARCIRETSPRSRILFVSEDRSPEIAEEGLRTGARGYITKSSAASELWPAIQAVLRGEVFLGKGLSIPCGDSAQTSPRPPTLLEEVPESAQSQAAFIMSEDNPPPLSRFSRFLRTLVPFPIAGWTTLVVISGVLGFFAGNISPRFSNATPQTKSVAPKPPTSKPVKSRTSAGHAQKANSPNARKLALLQAHKRHLQKLLSADEKQIGALRSKRSSNVRSIADPRVTAEHYEKALLSALAELRSLKETQASTDAELVTTRYRLNELEKNWAQQRGLADHTLADHSLANNDGRSIAVPSALELRNLIAARNLHIADVSDVNTRQDEPKPFGRVFYTRSKSLILFAYDLSKAKPSQTFYAWGSRQNDTRPQSLGALRTDDQSQRRWILEFNDPKVLAQIDSVYITLEPSNKPGDVPNGRKLLSAYLGPSPKYR